MREVQEKPKQQYFRIFGRKKFHIATREEIDGKSLFATLCGYFYRGNIPAEQITEYYGDECMNCRHATSKRTFRYWRQEWVLEIKIRRRRQPLEISN